KSRNPQKLAQKPKIRSWHGRCNSDSAGTTVPWLLGSAEAPKDDDRKSKSNPQLALADSDCHVRLAAQRHSYLGKREGAERGQSRNVVTKDGLGDLRHGLDRCGRARPLQFH